MLSRVKEFQEKNQGWNGSFQVDPEGVERPDGQQDQEPPRRERILNLAQDLMGNSTIDMGYIPPPPDLHNIVVHNLGLWRGCWEDFYGILGILMEFYEY